jgi:hypothetical protein
VSYVSALNLHNAVSVVRTVETGDGMGGFTSTTSTVVLSRAALWTAGGQFSSFVSDQVMAISSHILACLPGDDIKYTDTVTYDGATYEVTSHPEDVMQKGVVQIVPLKKVNQ